MSVRSAQAITKVFTTRAFATGAATDATGTPTGTLYVNGTADAASVTVTNITTGLYKAAVTLPTLAVGDIVDLRINATVSAVTDNAIIWSDTKDLALDSSYRPGIDWANVGSPTTSLALTGTTIASTQKVDVETIKTNPVVNMGTVTFPTTATLASTTNITAATGIDVTKLGGVTQSLTDLKDFADTGYDPATHKVAGVVLTDALTTYTNNTPQTGDAYAIVNSGTFGNAALKGFVDDIGVAGAGLTALGDARLANLDALVSSRMATYTQPTGFLAATFPASPAATGDAMALTLGERDAVAAALLALADGVETGVTVKQTLRLLAAGVAGKRSSCGTVTEQYDAAGSPGTARIVGNLDSSGNGTPTLTP